jgi:hypothetical protein
MSADSVIVTVGTLPSYNLCDIRRTASRASISRGLLASSESRANPKASGSTAAYASQASSTRGSSDASHRSTSAIPQASASR